jgi:pyruvate-formate lyase
VTLMMWGRVSGGKGAGGAEGNDLLRCCHSMELEEPRMVVRVKSSMWRTMSAVCIFAIYGLVSTQTNHITIMRENTTPALTFIH